MYFSGGPENTIFKNDEICRASAMRREISGMTPSCKLSETSETSPSVKHA